MYSFVSGSDREKKRRNVKEKRIIVIGWLVSKRGEQTRGREIRDLNFNFYFLLFLSFFLHFLFSREREKKRKGKKNMFQALSITITINNHNHNPPFLHPPSSIPISPHLPSPSSPISSPHLIKNKRKQKNKIHLNNLPIHPPLKNLHIPIPSHQIQQLHLSSHPLPLFLPIFLPSTPPRNPQNPTNIPRSARLQSPHAHNPSTQMRLRRNKRRRRNFQRGCCCCCGMTVLWVLLCGAGK